MFGDFRDGFVNSVDAFVDYGGVILSFERFEEGFSAFFNGHEPEEPKIVRMHSRAH